MSKARKGNSPKNKTKNQQPAFNATVVVHKYPSFVEWLLDFSASLKDRAVNISNRKSTLIISFIVLVLAVLIYYPSRTEDYDIWYHLAFGKYFIEHKTFKLDHSIFSWTPADPNWRYGIWLGSTALYIAYKILSVYGFYIIQWSIFAAIVLLYRKFIKTIGDSFDITHIMSLMLLFIALNLTAIYIKPEIFTTLFFAISVFVYFYTKFTSKNLFYIYPPLLFIWVNTHGGYLTGLMLISLALTGEALNYFLIKKNQIDARLLRHLAISVAASYIAVIFNPYGIDYHIGIVKSLLSKEYMSVATQVYAWIGMWDQLFPKGEFPFRFFNAGWALVIMAASFFAMSIYLYTKKKFFDITLLLLNAVFFYLGMKNARVTLFLPLIWIFSMLYILKKADAMNIKKKFAPLALILFISMAVYITDLSMLNLEDRSWFGSNLIKYAPAKEVEFVKKYKLPAPIFNDYLIGGYLIWAMYPDYKVFIDPRYGPYWKEVGPDYFALLNNLNTDTLKRFIEKYRFKTAIIHMRDRNVIFTFLTLPDWRIIYFNNTAAVLINTSVIPTLSQEALSTDMGTHRFRNIDNPIVLENLFNFYLQLGPVYAQEILDIYKNNVSDMFRYKAMKVQEMQNLVNQRQAQLQQQRQAIQQ